MSASKEVNPGPKLEDPSLVLSPPLSARERKLHMASEQQVTAAPSHAASTEMAIAFVVESSLTVANDWIRIMQEYVKPMLKRLHESTPNAKPRLAFITYATADTVPSPLVCKRFFVDSQPVMKEMGESPVSLGIGTTNSGGNRGMAALEGLVAAIELFEVFTSAVPRGKLVLSHIVHIASVSPDSSVHPRFNDQPKYDAMTWETMADEMRNRNINFNTINLSSNLKRFPELHAKASKDILKPFFPIRSSHSVLLAGIPPPPQKASAPTTPAPVKRPIDIHNTPDPKRARLAPPMDVSPKVHTPKTPSNQPKPSPLLTAKPKVQPPPTPVIPPAPPPSVTPVLPPAPAPSITPVLAPAPAPNTFSKVPANPPQNMALPNNNVLAVFRNIEGQIQALRIAIQDGQNKGDVAGVERLSQELKQKQLMHQRAKDYLIKMQQAQAQLKNAHSGLNQEAPVVQSAVSPSHHPMDQQALTTMLHKRTASGSGPGPGSGPGSSPNNMQPRGLMGPQANPAFAAQMHQMQKMADQQRARSIQPNMAGSSNGLPGIQPPGPQPSHPGPPIDQRPSNNGPHSVWQGSLVFSGTDPQGLKKDTIVWVIGRSQSPPEASRVDTWPTAMHLLPSNKPAVPVQDLQVWIKNHSPILCAFQPQTNGIPDPAANEANFKSLITVLSQRKSYAVSAWTLPSGEQGNNIVFFPVNTSSLAAACFPLKGLPELPVTSRQIPNLLNVDFNSPEFLRRVDMIPPEQREQFLKTLKVQRALQMRQHMLGAQNPTNNPGANNSLMTLNALNLAQQNQQIQQQQQSQPPQLSDMTFGGNVHPPNNYGGMGMMNAMGLGQQPQTMMGGMSRPVNGGMRNTMPPNINFEMMQSFMTRNPDGGGMGQ